MKPIIPYIAIASNNFNLFAEYQIESWHSQTIQIQLATNRGSIIRLCPDEKDCASYQETMKCEKNPINYHTLLKSVSW